MLDKEKVSNFELSMPYNEKEEEGWMRQRVEQPGEEEMYVCVSWSLLLYDGL